MAHALQNFEIVQGSDLRIPNMIAFASGKGGVGKTCLAIAFSQALANAGRRVLLVDGDLGLANVDVQLGATPKVDLGAVIANRKGLDQAQMPYLKNMDIIAGRSGSSALGNVPADKVTKLLVDLLPIAGTYDIVVLDTATGISETSVALTTASNDVLMILTDDPSSLTNAFALTKRLINEQTNLSLSVLVNLAKNKSVGAQTFETFRSACETTLGIAPVLKGIVSHDEAMPQAIRQQSPVLSLFPRSKLTREIREIAEKSL